MVPHLHIVSPVGRRSILTDTEGLSFVEYLIVLCVVALLGFAAWRTFGNAISGQVMLASNDVKIISTAGGGTGGGGSAAASSGGGGGAGPSSTGAGGPSPASSGGGDAVGGAIGALDTSGLPSLPTAPPAGGSPGGGDPSGGSAPSTGPGGAAGGPSGAGAFPSGPLPSGSSGDGTSTSPSTAALSTGDPATGDPTSSGPTITGEMRGLSWWEANVEAPIMEWWHFDGGRDAAQGVTGRLSGEELNEIPDTRAGAVGSAGAIIVEAVVSPAGWYDDKVQVTQAWEDFWDPANADQMGLNGLIIAGTVIGYAPLGDILRPAVAGLKKLRKVDAVPGEAVDELSKQAKRTERRLLVQDRSLVQAQDTAEEWARRNNGWAPSADSRRHVDMTTTKDQYPGAIPDSTPRDLTATELPPGWAQVDVHGSNSTFSRNELDAWGAPTGASSPTTPSEIAAQMRAGGYTNGPVRLSSCETGACTNFGPNAAQQLADELGAPVVAPTGVLENGFRNGVGAAPDRQLTIIRGHGDPVPQGRWRTYLPGGGPKRPDVGQGASSTRRSLDRLPEYTPQWWDADP